MYHNGAINTQADLCAIPRARVLARDRARYGTIGAVLFFIAFFAFLLLRQFEEPKSHQTLLWIIALMLIVAARASPYPEA